MAKRKKGTSTKETTSSNRFGSVIGLQKLLDNEKFDFILGLFSFITAFYIIIAFVSFLKTGQADQSILENLRPREWMNDGHIFVNYCGSFGAIISYFFITLNFGLPAFLIPFFFIIVGLKLMRVYNFSVMKWFLCLALVMIWSSVTFAKFLAPIMSGQVYNPGGNHGLYCVQRLENIIGPPGLTIVLILTAIVFLTILSSQTVIWIRKMMNPVKYLTNKVQLSVTNAMETQSETTDEEETVEPALQDNELEEDDEKPEQQLSPTVVDLTDMTEEPEAEGETQSAAANEAAAQAPVINVPLPAQPSSSQEKPTSPSDIVVEVAKNEEKAHGGTVAGTVDLNTPINPKEPFTRYKYPVVSLLEKYDNDGRPTVDMDEIKANNARIVSVLSSFGVDIKEVKATVGPTITLYEVTPAEGVRISKIRNLEDDIALSLSALGIRIIAPRERWVLRCQTRKRTSCRWRASLTRKSFKSRSLSSP